MHRIVLEYIIEFGRLSERVDCLQARGNFNEQYATAHIAGAISMNERRVTSVSGQWSDYRTRIGPFVPLFWILLPFIACLIWLALAHGE